MGELMDSVCKAVCERFSLGLEKRLENARRHNGRTD